MKFAELILLSTALFLAAGCGRSRPSQVTLANATSGDVVFSNGYQTDQRDNGRPVRLIAAALGVEEQVFRGAFSGVNPSKMGAPSSSRAQANKKVLMDALGPYGITNERLDEVSNYYRYRPQNDELWTHVPAKASAIIKDGKVVDIKIEEAGSGYMEPPDITIAGHESVNVKAKIEFTNDLSTNGRIVALEIVQ